VVSVYVYLITCVYAWGERAPVVSVYVCFCVCACKHVRSKASACVLLCIPVNVCVWKHVRLRAHLRHSLRRLNQREVKQ